MSWVGLPIFLVLSLLIPCLDDDALDALRSPSPDPDSKDTKYEDIKLIPLLSVKAEFANVKTENDDGQRNIPPVPDPRTPFTLDILARDNFSLNTYRIPTLPSLD